ncbi:MAG: argininosuccinate lyase [Dehalococcoidia bacterium]|nr:argininosuccinate lyase [Dehalococcoidia bacterium]
MSGQNNGSNENTTPAAAARGSELASDFTVSVHYDSRMYKEDIAGSIAHARMLGRQGIIESDDTEKIVDGLTTIAAEMETGEFVWNPDLEDIHMNVESRLYELIGDAAGRLHTARSRNDQVATDTRLWTQGACARAFEAAVSLQTALVNLAEQHIDTIVPGYTHMQRGQPVVLAHHLMAYFEMFDRDATRFAQTAESADVLPLGSGAMAGVPYDIDRKWVADQLDFDDISRNSMDAVSDRDFIVEFLTASSLAMAHLSRLAEELVIWSSDEFGFIKLSDEYTSGSSIMPQKRNPDFAELIRGKTGRVYGSLMGLLITIKGLPLTYNRDLQEDKEGLFDAADTVITALEAAAGMISGMTINADRMRQAASNSFVLATDIADHLVDKGVPFREAYIAVSDLSKQCIADGIGFGELSLSDFQKASDLFDEGVMEITLDSAVAARNVPGGTAPERVRAAITEAKQMLAEAE